MPVGARHFSPKPPDRLWGPPSLFSGHRGSFLGRGGTVNWPVHETAPSPSCAEVKNEWRCTTTPPMCVHDVTWTPFFGIASRRSVCVPYACSSTYGRRGWGRISPKASLTACGQWTNGASCFVHGGDDEGSPFGVPLHVCLHVRAVDTVRGHQLISSLPCVT